MCIKDNSWHDSRFSVMENGSEIFRTSVGTNPYTGDWEWVQVIRDNGTTKAYVNGSERGSASSTTDISGISTIYIGHDDYTFNGSIRDFRISNVARSTTVPTEPLESDSDTLILTCNKGYLIDQGPNSIPLTTGSTSNRSDPVASTSIPYDFDEYDAADNGGSIYFDGTGDYLNLSSSTDFDLTSSSFTIKFWVYHTEWPSGYMCWIDRFGNTTDGRWALRVENDRQVRLTIRDSSGNMAVNDYSGSSNLIQNKQWYYVEWSGGTVKVNGQTWISYTHPNTGAINSTLKIGSGQNAYGNPEAYIQGYMSDIQIVNGSTAAESSVPTAPMTTASNSKLHLKCTDASIIDKSGSDNLTLSADTKCTTTAVVHNSSTISSKSILFDGTGDKIPLGNLLHFGDNNSVFSIEMWAKFDTLSHSSGYLTLFGDDAGSGNCKFWLGVRSNKIAYKIDSNVLQSGSATLSTDTWYHIAFVRSGLNTGHSAYPSTRTFVNGTLDQTDSTWRSPYAFPDNPTYLGSASSYEGLMDGYIQDFRFRKGYVGWVLNGSTYTYPVPTAELKG